MTVLPTPTQRPQTTALGVMDVAGGVLVSAISADNVWSYRRFEDHWIVKHLPSELEMPFHSITAGRQWTATGDRAVADLKALAVHLVTADFVLPEQRAGAAAGLRLFGDLLPNTADVYSVCVCGGYLAQILGGRKWIHVDTCPQELADGPGPCPDDRNGHRLCLKPEPAQCGHHRCLRPHDVNAVGCVVGHPACCGCCHGQDQV